MKAAPHPCPFPEGRGGSKKFAKTVHLRYRPLMTSTRGFLVYMAIGDAYGMAYEFASDIAAVGPNDLTYKKHPTHLQQLSGHYGDDTQMSWINAEILVQRDTARLIGETFADAWVFNYHQDPRVGYSRRMTQALSSAADGADFMTRIDATKGVTSGAAMRAGVIGLLPDTAEVRRIAALQAAVTHNTPAGIVSAQTVALAVHALHYNLCPVAGLPAFLDGEIGIRWRTLNDGGDPNHGLYIVRQALGVVQQADTLSDVLRGCVDLGPGQDTDTVAAIAMAIASRAREIADDLPPHLFAGLEDGPYGRTFLAGLDRGLAARFPPPAPPAARPVLPLPAP